MTTDARCLLLLLLHHAIVGNIAWYWPAALVLLDIVAHVKWEAR